MSEIECESKVKTQIKEHKKKMGDLKREISERKREKSKIKPG